MVSALSHYISKETVPETEEVLDLLLAGLVGDALHVDCGRHALNYERVLEAFSIGTFLGGKVECFGHWALEIVLNVEIKLVRCPDRPFPTNRGEREPRKTRRG